MDNPSQEIQEMVHVEPEVIQVDMRLAAATAYAEQEGFDLFQARYAQLNPAPIEPDVTIKDMLGWEFYGSILSAIATLLLAGFATAGEFYHIAETTSQNGIFTWGRTISAIMGVEGLIVVMSVLSVLTKEKNTISRSQYETAKKLALFVSVCAGFNGVLRGILPMDNIFVMSISFLVSATLAVGASFLALTGGEIVGYQTRYSRELLAKTNADYLTNKKIWWDTLVAEYANSYERGIARGKLIPTMEIRSPFGARRTNAPSIVGEKIKAYLTEQVAQGLTPGVGVLGPSAIAAELGVSKGYASDVIKTFISNQVNS